MFQRDQIRIEEGCGVRTPKTWSKGHENRAGRRGAGFLRIKAVGGGTIGGDV